MGELAGEGLVGHELEKWVGTHIGHSTNGFDSHHSIKKKLN